MNVTKSYDAGMAPPIGGVDSGGRRRDFSLTDMAAISGSWVSYIFTSLANFRTPGSEHQRSQDQCEKTFLRRREYSTHISTQRYLEKTVVVMCLFHSVKL